MANVFDQFDQNMPKDAAALPNQIPELPGSSGSGYADVVESAGAKWGIPAGLMSAVVGKESGGNAGAVSSKGALGLTQVMPGTARDMGYDPAQLAQDPAMQADAGAQYLSRMYQRYGDWGTALQAYHDGPGNVDKQLAGQATPGPEGRQYVDQRFDQWTKGNADSDGSGEPTQYATGAKSGAASGNVFDQFGEFNPGTGSNADATGAAGADQQVPAVAAGNDANQAGSDVPQGAAAPEGNGVTPGVNQPGQADPNAEAAQNWQKLGQSAEQAGRGIVQTGLDLLNTPISLANMAINAGTDAAKAAGLVDESTKAPTITPGGIPGFEGPTDSYAQIGTTIGDLLAPLPGPRKAQAATELMGLAKNASPEVANLISKLADGVQNFVAAPAARAVPGAVAAGRGDPEETLQNIALAPVGEAVGRAAIAGVSKAAGAIRTAADETAAARAGAGTPPTTGGASEAGISDAVARDASKFRLTPDRSVTGANGETLRASDDAIDLANMADVDRKVLKSARDLGMEDQLTPAAYTRDPNFRNTVQQLASRKGSALEAQQAEGIGRLAGKADELIESMSSMNANTLDQAFTQRTRAIIDDLGDQAEKVYTRIGEKIPKGAQIEAPASTDYLLARADELRGSDALSAAEKKSLEWLSPTSDRLGPPSYARLDTLRKQVGQAINKKQGIFKDEEVGSLKQLYARLTDDQEKVAAQYGAADDWNAGKQLVKRRKDLETMAQDALGKGLTDSVSGKFQDAILNLGKKGGSAKNWNKLIAATPDGLKQDVVANALQRTLAARSQREGSLSIPGFVDWYRTAQANGTLGSVMKHLSRSDRARLMQIYRVGNAIDKARRLTTTTGSIGDFVKRFDDPSAGGILSKLYGTAGWMGKHAAAYMAAGPAGNAALSAAQAAGRARVPRSVLADNLLSSPDFSKLVQAAAAQSSGKLTPAGRAAVREAENAASNSPEWKALIASMSDEEKAAVSRAGIVGFLSGAGGGAGRAAAAEQDK